MSEVATRRLPRPVPVARPLPRPWASSGPGEYSLNTEAGAAFVVISGGEVTISAADSRPVLRHLATLLEWDAWSARHSVPGDKVTSHSSLYPESVL